MYVNSYDKQGNRKHHDFAHRFCPLVSHSAVSIHRRPIGAGIVSILPFGITGVSFTSQLLFQTNSVRALKQPKITIPARDHQLQASSLLHPSPDSWWKARSCLYATLLIHYHDVSIITNPF